MSLSKTRPVVPTANEVPVTREMLMGVRDELSHQIERSRAEAKADNQRLDGKIDAVRAELKADMHELKTELKADMHELRTELKADMHELRADMHQMKAGIARIEVLVEEQNARNKIVLDALTAVLSRQDQLEDRVTKVEDTVRDIASGRPVKG